MKLPKIGDIVTTDQAIKLSRHFGLEHIADRIAAAPEKYHDWEFDGCSGLPDEVMGFFTGCRWEDITYKCCLPHDLGYAYGTLGDEAERKAVDEKFYADLIQEAGMQAWCAKAFLAAVRVGAQKFSAFHFRGVLPKRKLDSEDLTWLRQHLYFPWYPNTQSPGHNLQTAFSVGGFASLERLQ